MSQGVGLASCLPKTAWPPTSKITAEVTGLIHRGILVEVGEGNSLGGRRPRLLKVNGQLGFVIGIDIGATSFDIAVADLNARVLVRESGLADVRDEPDALLGVITDRILKMLTQAGLQAKQVLGIGIGVPGPVDFANGVLVAPPLMPAWEGFRIRDYFQAAFPAACVMVDNDVNIMALGELRGGAGVDIDNFIFVKIGTGIGAGIVCNGRVYRGTSGSAGDIGHICADHNGPICRCGNIGCLEMMAAGPAIADRAMAAARNGASPILAKKTTIEQRFAEIGRCSCRCPRRRSRCDRNHSKQRTADRRCAGRLSQLLQSQSAYSP